MGRIKNFYDNARTAYSKQSEKEKYYFRVGVLSGLLVATSAVGGFLGMEEAIKHPDNLQKKLGFAGLVLGTAGAIYAGRGHDREYELTIAREKESNLVGIE